MKSVWTEKTKIREREPLPGDMEAPAVVIGAGLAGILTAYYLKQAGIRAVVLEADRIGSGQTKNTTAKITSQHNLLYSRLIRTFGHRMAEHYASANEAAIGEYERLVFERQASFHPLKFLAKMAEEVEVYEQTKVLKVEEGVYLKVCRPGLEIKGKLAFGPLSPLRYNIMGPFSFVPFMECRHSIWSMKHMVRGSVYINGTVYSFDGAEGYWEGDSGRSFPKEYIWTQCSFPEGALMLSVADIPMAGFRFQGVVGIVLLNGREYRLATYLGARVIRIQNGLVRVVQGNLELETKLLERAGKPLKAPTRGNMARTIHESVACRAKYRFRKNGRTLLAFETDRASFEYEYRGCL